MTNTWTLSGEQSRCEPKNKVSGKQPSLAEILREAIKEIRTKEVVSVDDW